MRSRSKMTLIRQSLTKMSYWPLLTILIMLLVTSCSKSDFSGGAGSGRKSIDKSKDETQSPTIDSAIEPLKSGDGTVSVPDQKQKQCSTDVVNYGKLGGKNSNGFNGRVVFGHDVNTLSQSIGGTTEQIFSVNLARWLSGKLSGKVLVLEPQSDASRNFSLNVLAYMKSNGWQVDVAPVSASRSLAGYDVLFLSSNFPAQRIADSVPSLAVLNFIRDGGGVYLVGGVNDVNAAEFSYVNSVATNFGVNFVVQNELANVQILDETKHPILTCVTKLGSGRGYDLTLSGATQSQVAGIVQNPGNSNLLYVAFDGTK